MNAQTDVASLWRDLERIAEDIRQRRGEQRPVGVDLQPWLNGRHRELSPGGVRRHRRFSLELLDQLANLDTLPVVDASIHANLGERLRDEVLQPVLGAIEDGARAAAEAELALLQRAVGQHRRVDLQNDSARRDGFVVPETQRVIGYDYFLGPPKTVSDNYFRLMGIPIQRGRSFDSSDVASSRPVAVVSRHMASDVWGEADPIGKQLIAGKLGTRVMVIGVVGDVASSGQIANGKLRPQPRMYFSQRQTITCCNRATLVVHTTVSKRAVEAFVTTGLKALGRDIPVTVMTFEEDANRTAQLNQMLSGIFITFATCGLLLAMMGIYGVIAFTVEQRTREIGVRVALGATVADIIRHVMSGGIQLIASAIAIGVLASALAAKVLTSFVLGSYVGHLATILVAAVVFAAIGAIACYVPARRSTKLDPLVALRSD